VRFNLQQFTAVFDLRDAEGKPYVIIGGQAVNYWAETYLAKESGLAQWMPFTSKDIDFQGNRDDVLRIAKALGVRAQLPDSREMTALAGIIPFEIGDLRTNIEVVRSFPGMPKARIHQWALTANRGGKEIRVLDPLSLLDSKLHLALKVNQKERRDVEHLRIMLLCVRAFLRETLHGVEAGSLPARGWLGALERVLKLAESSRGKKAVRTLQVDWTEAFPLAEIAASSHPAAKGVRERRLVRWHSKLVRPA
jgi:hypothetical protein